MNSETKGGEPADERAALLAEAKEIAAATGSKDVRAFAESVAELLQSKTCASVGVEPDDERAAFEEHRQSITGRKPMTWGEAAEAYRLTVAQKANYVTTTDQAAWESWQGRAALASPAPSVGEPARRKKLLCRLINEGLESGSISDDDAIFLATPPAAPAVTYPDPLQGAADWLKTGLVDVSVADIQSRLLIGYNRARRLFDGAPAAAVPESPADPLRVACVTLDGSTLTVPVAQLGDVLHGEDDQHTYTLTFKTMTRAEFDALGDFNGF